MPTPIGLAAQEFDALISRTARTGRLDVEELVGAYAALVPGSHALLAEPRRLDLDALVAGLNALPAELVTAPAVLVVPRLEAFTVTPVAAQAARAGVLTDGTLLIEGRLGHLSLLAIASALCAVQHEVEKAHSLLYALLGESADCDDAGAARPGRRTKVAAERLGAGEDVANAGGSGTDDRDCGDDCSCADGSPDDCDCSGDCSCAEGAQDDCDCAGDCSCAEGAQDDCDCAGEQELPLAQVAFALGIDEARWEAADRATAGRFSSVVSPDWELPVIAIHPDFAPQARARAAGDAHARIGATLAEMGLLQRPVHLWVGPAVLTDCLSPYTRELREAIITWAHKHGAESGDVSLDDGALGEDALYALAHDFLASDPRLAIERRAADRTVGILREEADGRSFDIVDLGRVDARVVDARLPRWQRLEPAPVLLRVSPDLEDATGAGLAALLQLVAPRLATLTLAFDGGARGAADGALYFPDILVRWAGEHIVAVPAANRLQPGDFAGLAGNVAVGGGALSVPHAALLSPAHLGALAQELKAATVTVGADPTLAAVAKSVWAGVLGPETEIVWGVVSGATTGSGRPTVATLSGQTALALWRLRGIVASCAPQPPHERKKPAGPGSGRQVRIKA